jgi:hypothetical protein
MPPEPIDALIARSSLGRPGVRRLARRTNDAITRRVLVRGGVIADRDFHSPPTPTSMTTSAPGARRTGSAQEEGITMAGRRTSPRAAKAASKVLRDGRTLVVGLTAVTGGAEWPAVRCETNSWCESSSRR